METKTLTAKNKFNMSDEVKNKLKIYGSRKRIPTIKPRDIVGKLPKIEFE